MDNRLILVVSQSQQDFVCCRDAFCKIRHVKYQIEWQPEPEKLLEELRANHYQGVLVNSTFSQSSAADIVKQIRQEHPWLPIVLMTQSSDEILPVVLIAKGAQEYIDKEQINKDTLHNVVSKAIFSANQDFKRNQRRESPSSVLIIDDNPDDVEFCVRSLQKQSKLYQCKSATSATQGLQLINTFYPDCVILDHSMPGTTGLDLLPEILSVAPGTPVIMLTGHGDESTAVAAMKRGAQNYLVKADIDGNLLHKSIMEVVEKKRLENEVFRNEQALSRKHNELSSAYAFQDLVIDSLPDFVYVKNPQHRIVRANKAFMALFPDELNVIGSTLEEFFQEEFAIFLAKDKQAFQLGYSESMENITFPDGRKYLLFSQKKLFVDADGSEFILCVSKDVTEREALISQLETSNQDLEQFVYIASHDLKTPLNGIKRVVGWIEEDHASELSPELKGHFDLIKNRTGRISQLLQDLLDYAKVNSKLDSEESIDFYEFCHQTYSLLDANQPFSVSAPHVQVQLPRIALQIVLMNLFSNSIKHHDSQCGVINVHIEACEKGYQLQITDDGPGIPPVYAEKVFQMFQTLKSRDIVEGSGMGLAMVRKVLEHYGGSIALDENYHNGCQMQIFWPVKQNTLVALEVETT